MYNRDQRIETKFVTILLTVVMGINLILSPCLVAQDLLDAEGLVSINGKLQLEDSLSSLFLGDDAGRSIQGELNTFIGEGAGSGIDFGIANTMVGARSGFGIVSGNSNTIFGHYSPFLSATGYHIDGCTFVGNHAGNLSLNGVYNTAIGHSAGRGTIGDQNTFFGASSGRFVDTVHATTSLGYEAGYRNKASASCFVGALSGWSNTTGYGNVFLGTSSGYQNSTGQQNTIIGHEAGFENQVGHGNIFIGSSTGRKTTGSLNTYVGHEAGREGPSSEVNTFLGWHSGYINQGLCNVMVGSAAGAAVQGSDNIFLGSTAGTGSTSSQKCIALGFEAGFVGNYTNSIAIGSGARCNASNKVRIGNNQVSVIEGQVNFSAASDYRLKENYNALNAGIAFIQKLRPVNYQWKKGDETIHTGVIAQEVENVMISLGLQDIAVTKSEDKDGWYSLRYAELVMPLIVAIKELSRMNESLYTRLKTLEQKHELIKEQIP